MLTTPIPGAQRQSREYTLHSWPEKTNWTLGFTSKDTIEDLDRQGPR
jgi:hypothetical protein